MRSISSPALDEPSIKRLVRGATLGTAEGADANERLLQRGAAGETDERLTPEVVLVVILGPDRQDCRSSPFPSLVRHVGINPRHETPLIDPQREMNDPVVAAVIFVEQPEGLCGLTNRSTSTCVISASTVDREGTTSNEATPCFPQRGRHSDDPGTNLAGPRDG
jgi:hypothetical protein